MEISKEFIKQINSVYKQLELKRIEIAGALFKGAFEIKSDWYNGHYKKGDDGRFQRDYYPIPVVEVRRLCDVEIDFDKLTVTTKLRRKQALEYSYEMIKPYTFEVYGVDDYLSDFYHEGQTVQELRKNISNSDEKEIGYSFSFPFDVEGVQLLAFVKLLKREGFYY